MKREVDPCTDGAGCENESVEMYCIACDRNVVLQ